MMLQLQGGRKMEMINIDNEVITYGNNQSCAYGCGYCNWLDLCYMKDTCPLCGVNINICPVNCVCGIVG